MVGGWPLGRGLMQKAKLEVYERQRHPPVHGLIRAAAANGGLENYAKRLKLSSGFRSQCPLVGS